MSGPDDLLRELYPSIVAPTTLTDLGPDDPTTPELPHVPDDDEDSEELGLLAGQTVALPPWGDSRERFNGEAP